MIKHIDLSEKEFLRQIRKGKISLAGNLRLKIYGTLHCRSGKRMKKVNRVFFTDHQDGRQHGFRPCAHCMPVEYRQWKSAQEMG